MPAPTYKAVPTDFKKDRSKKLAGLTDPAIALVESIKPYTGGGPTGDDLAILNKLSRFDKHKLLNLVVVIPNRVAVGPMAGGVSMFHNFGVPLEDKALVAEVVCAVGSEMNCSARLKVHFEPGGRVMDSPLPC